MGAIVAGVVADVAGFSSAIIAVAFLTALSGAIAWVRMPSRPVPGSVSG